MRTLELCADARGDIVPAVYECFFGLSDEARSLMAHSDQYMQGRMFEQVLDLVMSDEHFERGGYLEWELDNHLDAYHATPAMYEAFFHAVTEVVREGVGTDWTNRDTLAWQDRIDRVMEQVKARSDR